MRRLPPLRTREVVKGLQSLGFERVRQKGSRAVFHHSDCRRAAVPMHPTKTFSPYLLTDILHQLEIDRAEFLKAAGRRR